MSGNHVEVIVNGHPVRALVDSGASSSVISERYRRHLRKTMFPTERKTMLKVADGNYVQPLGKCVLRLEINGRIQPFEFTVLLSCSHDIILGWDFLQASQAVIDCGRSELTLEDVFHETSNIRSWTLHAVDTYTIPAHSAAKISVASLSGDQNFDVIVDRNIYLLLTKELALPDTITTLSDGNGELWVVNGQSVPQIIPKGMLIGNAEALNKDCVNVISLTESSNAFQTKSNCVSVDYSSMLASNLTSQQRKELLNILQKYQDVFDETRGTKALKGAVKHRIKTGDHEPISQRAYRVAPTERRVIQEEVEKMLARGIIRPSESPWSSPVVLVKKKDGTWRFCVDYRRLNKITKKDVYPLPRIDDTLDCLKRAKFFSSMDLRSGYWQIEVDEADREKTAFITPEGLYEFKVMPFGLCNAPATFERMMDNLLRHLKWTMCLCYLDDIIVFSETFYEHLVRLSAVLNCIQEAGLILNSKKCVFAAQQIKILGHLVSEGSVRPDPDKVKSVTCFPVPKNIHDVRSFLGLCSYYRRFIQDFCHKAQPLQILLKGDSKYCWGPEQDNAFQELKKALTSDPVLGLYDEEAATALHTDASGYGIGAVLVQAQDGQEKVIAYASRTLTKAERNYSTTERECLAAVWAVHKFRPYLFGKSFIIVTDHHSLCWLASLKDPSGRLARWALRLQEYDFSVVYKSGKKHQDADSLSRNPIEGENFSSEEMNVLSSFKNIMEEQMKDANLVEIMKSKRTDTVKTNYELVDGILCKKNFDPDGKMWLPLIPKHLRKDILQYFHDSLTAGHLGFARTYDRIRKRFYWPGLYRTVRRYVMHCRDCQRRKAVPQKPPGHLVPIPPAPAPFYQVGIDLLGRFPKSSSGNKWIIVCTDYLTRYAVTKALPTAEASEVAEFMLKEILLRHGAPRIIITDRGRVFESKLVSELANLCSIDHRMTTAYHPQTNGLTERFNKTLADMLSMYVDIEQKDWDKILPFVTFAYNTAKQNTTGFTPFYLLHGREAETTLDTMFPFGPEETESDYAARVVSRAEESRQLARLRTLEAQEKDCRRYNAKHRMVHYKTGDLVWIFTPVRKVGLSEKLLKRYFGPYQVLRQLSDVTYEVQDFDPSSRRRKQKDVVHVLRMKPYFDPEDQLPSDSEDQLPDDPSLSDRVEQGKGTPISNCTQLLSRPLKSGPMTRSKTKALSQRS